MNDTINKVKDDIYKELSYTSQSYEEILLDIISAFKGTNSELGLTTKWDNISEADIMFIFMSLLAAHKDMLNYMLDYRVQETFMNTAKERASVARIAKSFGYKIPAYRAARALMTLSSLSYTGSAVPEPSDPKFDIEPFTLLVDSEGVPWTYVDTTKLQIGLSDTIELYQGTPITKTGILASDFINNTHIIDNKNIAIGNNYNNTGCSRLTYIEGATTTNFTEVPNVYTYAGDNPYVYQLDVDPLQTVYIRFPNNLDLGLYTSGTFTFDYLLTAGSTVKVAGSIIIEQTDNILDDDFELTLQQTEFMAGSNSAEIDFIREDFKRYYASAGSLVTLNDYKNFILYAQKVIRPVAKCLIIDGQSDTIGGSGDSTINPLTVGVYIVPGYGEDAYGLTDLADLKATLLEASVSGISIVMNAINDTSANPAAEYEVYVKFDIAITNEIKQVVADYINTIGFGEVIAPSDIHQALVDNGYPEYYNKIQVGNSISTGYTAIVLDYWQYPTCDVTNISET